MKQDHSVELDRRKTRIDTRLARQSMPLHEGPVLRGGNEKLEMSERVRATAHGGIVLVHRFVKALGLPTLINDSIKLFKAHCPYHESDHVLNIAYNIICGGRTLEDIEQRREDEAYMDALGALRIPDPTTAGDFLRRFDRGDIDSLSEAFNEARSRVWSTKPPSFFERAIIDIDGTIAGTEGECKEGMDLSYKGIWGYAPLVVSLANTGEILYTRNRSGNRTSQDGCFDYLDPAVEVAREAGFKKVRLRGDTAFALTEDFDHWTDRNVEFVFGMQAHKKLVGRAEGIESQNWKPLHRKDGGPCRRGERKVRHKENVIKQRGYKNFKLESEHFAEFHHQPNKCDRPYRIVALRKTLKVSEGETLLFPEVRYFFYITNLPKSELGARGIIREANQRCNQENLIEQTKNGVHAMRSPCDTLLANDAYMVIACLAWNIKAWMSLVWPDKEEGAELQRMEFRRFVASVVAIPCQIVSTGRRIVHRFLAYSQWSEAIFRAHAHFRRLRFN